MTTVVFLVVFAVYAVWLGSKFMNIDARMLDVHQNAPILILGLAVIPTLLAGQFDLSVASMATLTTSLAVGLAANNGWPFGVVLVTCVAVGLLGGIINGVLVVKLQVNTFIATLGTGGLFAGAASVFSKGTQITPDASSGQLPSWFAGGNSLGAFGSKFPTVISGLFVVGLLVALFFWLKGHRPARVPRDRWPIVSAAIVAVVVILLLVVVNITKWLDSISWTIGLLFVIGVVLWVLFRLTTYGRNLEATGANPLAARLAGVNTGRETIKAFVLGGLLAAVAGVLLAAGQGSAPVDAAATFLLPAFAAAFLSTVVLSTGQFTVLGTIIGGTFLVWVSQGLIVGGLAFTWTNVVNGLVLITAVAVSSTMRRTA